MRKEIVLAIIAGSIFGLIVAFGIWRLNSTISSKNGASTEASPTPSSGFSVTIAKPIENQIITSDKTKISGLTMENASVIISSADKDFFGTADTSGAYEIDVELASGINKFVLTAISADLKTTKTTLTLVYSLEFEESIEELQESEDVSEATDEIQKKVDEKVALSQNIPIGYIGVVTDLAKSTLQIKSATDEIMQVATAEKTSFINSVNKKTKIAFEDIALGDFVIAMGYKDINDVLNASIILVTKEPDENLYSAVKGTISEIGKASVSLSLTNGESKEITFPKTWTGPDLDDLEVSQTLIAIGKGEDFTIRTIKVVE